MKDLEYLARNRTHFSSEEKKFEFIKEKMDFLNQVELKEAKSFAFCTKYPEKYLGSFIGCAFVSFQYEHYK